MSNLHERAAQGVKITRFIVALGLALGAAQFAASIPARAGAFDSGGGNDNNQGNYGADHDQIYQVQRGDLVCDSREACGGPLAIPMNRPGYWYLPGGVNARLAQQGEPGYYVPAHLQPHVYHKLHHHY